MSKSLGNFIEIDLLEAYGRRYSIDAVRWYLATQGPLGATDADFAHARFVEVYNSDLANGIGNCASRVGNMIEKYFGGEVPDPKGCWAFDERAPDRPHANFDWPEVCRVLVGGAGERVLERFENDEALRTAIRLIGDVDLFINATAPFKLAKTVGSDPSASDRLAAILHCCAEAIRIASLLLYPAMPAKMAALWRTWNCSPLHDPEDPDSGFKAPLAELAEWGGAWSLRPGQRIAKGEALFMRADPAEPAPTV